MEDRAIRSEQLRTTNKKYYIIRSEYFAKGLAFLGFDYYKFGYGKDTEYSFENTTELQSAIKQLFKLRNEYRHLKVF